MTHMPVFHSFKFVRKIFSWKINVHRFEKPAQVYLWQVHKAQRTFYIINYMSLAIKRRASFYSYKMKDIFSHTSSEALMQVQRKLYPWQSTGQRISKRQRHTNSWKKFRRLCPKGRWRWWWVSNEGKKAQWKFRTLLVEHQVTSLKDIKKAKCTKKDRHEWKDIFGTW